MTVHASAEVLSSLLDGELTEAERREAERHLAGCADCRARLDSLGRVVGTLKRLERAAPPEALAQLVQRRVALVGTRRSYLDRMEERLQRLGKGSPLAVSFALVLALAVMVYLLSHGTARQQQRGVPIVVPTAEAAREFAAANAHREPKTLEAGGRRFVLSGERWLEHGLERDEAAGTLAVSTVVTQGSPEGEALLGREGWLEELLGKGEGKAVVFRDGEAVVEVRAGS